MTQTSAGAPPHAEETRSEARPAHDALSRLREDLFTDPFAPCPLPPLAGSGGGRLARRLPAGLRKYTRWAPHGAACGAAVVLFLGSIAKGVDFGSLDAVFQLALFFLVTAPVALVVLRPVAAYWLSYGGLVLSLLFSALNGPPWHMAALPCHLLVTVLVVLRTRPRVAAETWMITFGSALVLGVLVPAANWELPLVGALSALLLVAAAAVRAWRDEHRNVVETETVTAQERAHRTLLEERATIARELHDVVAHHMSVVAIQAEAAPYRLQDTPPELAAAFSTIRENAVAALTELRSILGLVRAEGADAFGNAGPEAPQPTLADLDGLLESVRNAGLTVESVVTGAEKVLPQGVELSAYRLVQEALSNTLRHSPGAAARVEISYVLGGLGLRVLNGTPSRLAKPSPGAGHGVMGMRERVQMLGGELTAEHTEDGGFEVTAFLPAPSAREDSREDGRQDRREDGREGGAHGAAPGNGRAPVRDTPARDTPARDAPVRDGVQDGDTGADARSGATGNGVRGDSA